MRRLGAAAAVLAVLALAGCGSDHGDRSLLGSGSPSPGPTGSVARDRLGIQRLLDRRAEALVTGDEKAFLAPVVHDDRTFLAHQRRLFRNLQQIPVGELRFTAVGAHEVRRDLQLAGFDTTAVSGPAGFAVERRGGRLVVVRAVGAGHQARDPWDLATLDVLRRSGTLLLYDDADAGRAADLLDAVSGGATQVASLVPTTWHGAAVVYAFRGPEVLASYARVRGGSLEHLGALSFPLRDARRRVVGNRIALLPAALDTDESALRRIVRHELTHVALGTRDDRVPVWLSEGIAEYVAAKPMPPGLQRIATEAVDAARNGFDALPDAATFHDPQQDLHYSEAWMACDYLARAQGDGVLWDLLDAMATAGVGRDGRGQDPVLRTVTGLDGHQIAERAAQRITRLFGRATTTPTG